MTRSVFVWAETHVTMNTYKNKIVLPITAHYTKFLQIMKVWKETASVFSKLARFIAQGETCALATLIRVKGSSYRKPGAKLLLRANGSMTGNISGGCLEEDLKTRAAQVIQTGKPELIHYDTGDDENTVWGLGLGCNGKIDIWLQPIGPNEDSFIKEVLEKIKLRKSFSLSPTGSGFEETLHPPPHLLVLGGGDDAVPLVRYAADAGFDVVLADHRTAYLNPALFPNAQRLNLRPEDGLEKIPHDAQTYVVIKNHALKIDKAWTHLLAKTDVPYIGLLGPSARRDAILKDIPAEALKKVYGPIGLDLGAEGAEQIALSIVTEILAIHAGRDPKHLKLT